MDRIWQWAWDRYGSRYSWALWAIVFQFLLLIYLVPSFVVVTFEKSDRYLEAAAVTAVGVLVLVYATLLPGLGGIRLAEQCAAGHEVDRAKALQATYTWARRTVVRAVVSNAVWLAVILVVVGAIGGAMWSRLVQYAILGAAFGTGVQVIAVHSFAEAALRPVRVAIAGDMGIGDSLPRSRPTFAVWSDVLVVAVAFVFTVAGAMVAGVFDRVSEVPVVCVVIGCALTLVFGVPMTVGASFSPSLRPIRDLAEGTKRVAAGDYGQRVPVVQDDDLGALAASFNRMQAGLAERQRLQAAFGTYVDPSLAARLLEQGERYLHR
jgi:HAMP domain-containing protein